MVIRSLAAAMVLATGSAALAQELKWTQNVSWLAWEDFYHNWEVALGLNQRGTDVVVAWIHNQGGGGPSSFVGKVYYNVSVNGEQFNLAGAQSLPGISAKSGDPTVVFSRSASSDGTSWIACLDSTNPVRMWVCRKNAGAQYVAETNAVEWSLPENPPFYQCYGLDKDWLMAGPATPGGPDILALSFVGARVNPNCVPGQQCDPPNLNAMRLITSTTVPLGTSWNYPGDPVGPNEDPVYHRHDGNNGGCSSAAILPTGTFAARQIAVYQTATSFASATFKNYNESSWQPSTVETRARRCPTNFFDSIGVSPGLGPNGIKLGCVRFAVNPVNPSIVYLAYSAVLEGASVTDLFIAQSLNGGASFLEQNVLHLTSAQLGEPADTNIIFGAPTVDVFGGVNVVFYSAWQDATGVWRYKPKHARIASFSACPESVITTPLIGASDFTLETSSGNFISGLTFDGVHPWVGDYVDADSRGCSVYVAFFSRHETSLIMIYVSKINLCPETAIAADVDRDSQVTSADATLFFQCYSLGDPRADVTRNGTIDGLDVIRFDQSFVCGCNP